MGLLPDVSDADVIELGCGTAYVGAWLAQRGGRVFGVDNSPRQLATAVQMQRIHDLSFPLVWGDAERLGFDDHSFDVAISECGAAIWCDPYRWIPEAARVLRPGGQLVFLCNSVVFILCIPELEVDGPADTGLVRAQRGMHRFEWEDSIGIEFHLSHGQWIDLFTEAGFVVERLVELYPGPDARTRCPELTTFDWASKWPCEEVWVLRKVNRADSADDDSAE